MLDLLHLKGKNVHGLLSIHVQTFQESLETAPYLPWNSAKFIDTRVEQGLKSCRVRFTMAMKEGMSK
jgi:hypothetical protein